jgi:hypothetical protein
MNEQKIEAFWRDATDKDVVRVMNGEKVEARFKSVDDDWTTACPREGFLAGWSNYDRIFNFIDDNGDHYRFCQVYDPPQWWLDKPDPGEGYRLLEKFPPEPKLATDQALAAGEYWQPVQNDNGVQEDKTWYRRRIEPNSPKKLDSLSIAFKAHDGLEIILPSGKRLRVTFKRFEVL